MNFKENPALLCDFYEFTMGRGYFDLGIYKKTTCFDLFFRSIPDGGGFAVAAGLEQVIDYIKNLRFNPDDIEYLRSKGIFGEDFLKYLSEFRFTGDILAIPEGTPVFPHVPMITVRAPAVEAQILETYLLMAVNHQSMIASKANRIVTAAKGRAVLEFGSRRAQGADAAVIGARAAYIGGCAGTACALADKIYGAPAGGTMAHSWVLMFDTEYEAFTAYCRIYPNNSVLLVDTYDTLRSGVPNAIRVIKEQLVPKGIRNYGIRLDSGDLTELSKKARKMLNEAGLQDCRIYISNSLDEHRIKKMLDDGAEVDVFGVGERLITSMSCPVLGCIYKPSAVEENGVIVPKIKVSNDDAKITIPHFKKSYRIYDSSGKAAADFIAGHDEVIDESKPLTGIDIVSGEKMTFTGFTARELLVSVFKGGECVYKTPDIMDIRKYFTEESAKMPENIRRFENPERYPVCISEALYELREEMVKSAKKQSM